MGKRAAPDATTGDAESRRVEREAKCRGTLEALNAQFAAWIARRAIESPIVSWRRGCEDYLKHLDRVKVDFGDVLERVEDENDGETTKATTTASDGRVDAKGSVNPFGGGAVAAVPAAGSIFGSLPTAPGSTFGAPFGGGGGLFGGGTAPGAGTAADDEDEDEPARPSSPSYQANEAVEDEKEVVLLRVGKVKFHTKKDAGDKNWADRGVNSFEFRREKAPSEGDVKRCRLLMRNTIGKAVLNAGLYPKMSSQLTEKKMKDGSAVQNGLIATVFNAEEENQKVMVYLRFGKESDAKELHKLISENVATL